MSDSPGAVVTAYLFGPYRLDAKVRELSKDGTVIPLTPKAFNTLMVLIEGRGRVVSKEELMKAVWPDAFVSDESLSQNIWGLRRALGDDTSNPSYIATIPRRGYRFVALVTELRDGETPAAAAEPGAEVPSPVLVARRPRFAIALAVVAIAAISVLATALLMRPGATAQSPVIRFPQTPPENATFASGGLLSPDGRLLAFVAQDARSGEVSLWVRAIDRGTARRLPGSNGVAGAFWAPDSTALAFFADDKLKRIDLAGDAPRTITDVGTNLSGGTWHANGTILIAQSRTGIVAVAAAGGTPTPITAVDRDTREWAHRFPQFLPDGRHFLFSVTSLEPNRSGTYVGAIDGSEKTLLLDESYFGVSYADPGFLIYVHDGDLIAQPFNSRARRLTGDPSVIATGVELARPAGDRGVSAAAGSFLAFGGGRSSHLTWYSRAGEQRNRIDSPTKLHGPMLLPGERQVVATSGGENRGGVWLVDLERGASNWLVPDGAAPLPSPDGRRIAFSSARRAGVADLYIRPLTGGDDELVLESMETKTAQHWSSDGRYLVYACMSAGRGTDLWLLPLTGTNRTPVPYLQTPFNEIQAQVSPDSRWIAYVSDESGRREVVVQSFPEPGMKRTVSAGGGSQPVWRPDGRELFYLAPDQTLMAVAVGAGNPLQFGAPQPLFQAPVLAETDTRRAQYAVTADGQRFLIDAFDRDDQDPITVLFNWRALLTQ